MTKPSKSVAIAMTIAVSHSGGGTGFQADMKTFAALGVYGTSVLTAMTSQNTLRVTDEMDLPVSQPLSDKRGPIGDGDPHAAKNGASPPRPCYHRSGCGGPSPPTRA